MDIYENLVVGNFLFGLGVEMSRRYLGRPMPKTFIGNLQQTPLDECYADVLVQNPGIFRLIEFKREVRRREKKETAKLLLLEAGLRSSKQAKRLAETSRAIHWFVESPKHRQLVHTVRATPYLDFRQEGETSKRVTLAEFVRDIAEEGSTSAKTEQEMLDYERYLKLLCICRGSQSAALVILITASGELQYEPVPDIRDLIRPRWQVINETDRFHYREMEQHKEKLVESQKEFRRICQSRRMEHEHLLQHEHLLEHEHRLSHEHRLGYSLGLD